MPSKKTRRVSEKRRDRNKSVVTATRTIVKKAHEALEAGSVEEAEQAVHVAKVAQDKAASKGIMHANTAARTKSRLSKRLDTLKAQKSAS